MPVVESRVRTGVLTICGDDFSCQPTSVSIQPSVRQGTAGNELEVLCGDKLSDAGSAEDFTATLNITQIADFADAAGLQAALWKNIGQICDFEWQPTGDATDKWVGKVKIVANEVGGQVGERLQPTVSLEITELTLPAKWGGQQVIPYTPPVIQPTGFTGGAPGTFTPAGATPPADLAALKAHGNVGDTQAAADGIASFGAGEYVVLGDASKAYWDGSVWQAGEHP